MKLIFKNLYIDTFSNFNNDIINELSNLTNYKIKHVVNLTECDSFNSFHKISLLINKIKCKDIFYHHDLLRIKKIPPEERSSRDIKYRIILREELVRKNKNFILNLSKSKDNILFLCNKNNVLSQLFVFIIMTLRNYAHHIPIYIKDRDIVTSDKNENDIRKYLDKYLDIIYNKTNEVSK